MRSAGTFFFLCMLTALPLRAERAVQVEGEASVDLSSGLWFLTDSSRRLDLTEIIKQSEAGNFQAANTSSLNPGYTLGAYWVRMKVENTSRSARAYVLEIAYPLLDEVEFWVLDGSERTDHVLAGRRHLESRKDRTLVFPLSLPAHSTRTLYIRAVSEDSLVLPFALRTPEAQDKLEARRNALFGTYYGIIIVMLVYNLILYFFVRDRAYIYYVLTLLTLHGAFQFSLNGHFIELVKNVPIWWIRDATAVSVAVGTAISVLFCRAFLIEAAMPRWWNQSIRIVLVWAGLNTALALLNAHLDRIYFYVIISAVGQAYLAALAVLAGGVVALYRGFRPARFYLVAWIFLIAGGLAYGLKIWGVLPSNLFTEHGWQAGSAVEATLLSLALGERISRTRRDREMAREEARVHRTIALMANEELGEHLDKLDRLKNHILNLDTTDAPLDVLLNSILANMQNVLGFERGFVIVHDRLRTTHIARSQGFPDGLFRSFPNERYLGRLLRVPAELSDELNRLIRLGSPEDHPFLTKPAPQNQAELARVIIETLEILRDWKFSLCIPLAYKREIFGYIILSEPTGGRSYAPADVKIIETFRMSVSMAVRSALLYDEVSLLRGKAEAQVSRLSDYVAAETTKRTLKEKTLVYASEAMAEVYESARKFAGKMQPVLITGETGTGKDVIAQAIHEAAGQDAGPMVAVNCAAIPAHLWESEVFGHVRGAFTDAKADHAGRVEQAGNGTLFFDEIGEMPVDLQAKLLRLIQERKFNRVGGDKTLEARCRFVFATNRDLEAMQARGLFREDLYYRISVFKIVLPPLRKRTDDIPALVNYFVSRYAKELVSRVSGTSESAMQALIAYHWPGNIRELENCMIQSIVNAAGEVLTPADLPLYVTDSVPLPEHRVAPRDPAATLVISGTFDEMVNNYSKEVIRTALDRCGGNKIEAARILGVKRATFYYRLKELGLE